MNKVCVGVITGAHGMRGAVSIKAFTEDPATLGEFDCLENETGKQSVKIKSYRINKGNVVIAQLEGVDDRNGAEDLRGTRLYVQHEELEEPKEDEFYYSDLVGLSVRDESGAELGKVHEVYNYGAGDLIDIQLLHSSQSVTLIFNSKMVLEVNIEEGFIVVDTEYFAQLKENK